VLVGTQNVFGVAGPAANVRITGGALPACWECIAGPYVYEPPMGCEPAAFLAADFDDDGDMDLADYATCQVIAAQ
jgi:hypothetical protein